VQRRGSWRVLTGTMRFCSDARVLDRALVVVDPPDGTPADGRLLLDVDVTGGVEPVPGSWCTSAMADADTLDVVFHDVVVTDGDLVGEPGWYVGRPGFVLGGAGVAAVWWGGAAGVLDRVLRHLRPEPDAHQLAHVGELHAALAAADALLGQTAAAVDAAADAAADPQPTPKPTPLPTPQPTTAWRSPPSGRPSSARHARSSTGRRGSSGRRR